MTRIDKRRWIIPAMLIVTGALGWVVQQAGERGVPVTTTDSVLPQDMSAEEQVVQRRFQQAVGLLQARNYDYAIRDFHDVLRLRPDMPEAHANMGFALLGIEEYAAARDFFDAATEIRSSQTNAYYGLAVAYEGLGELQNALQAMQTFVHTTNLNDPHRRKAEAAIWEWGAGLVEQHP